MRFRSAAVLLPAIFFLCGFDLRGNETAGSGQRRVYVLPVRDDIMPPLVYLVRRGIKAAMEARADLLVLDMDTNGGRVDVTEEIIEILNNFKGQTATYVNRKAFSAGAFIAVATQKIFMAPQSVIGAAAPIMIAPGAGPQDMPGTMEVKMNSAVRALVRTAAEKNGHNVDVVDAIGLYIEFKSPGCGLPGIIGSAAFAIYFLGGYIAGLSALEWVAIFLLGLILVALELFVFPGTMALGLTGAALMLVALIMAMVDFYPVNVPSPGLPHLPTFQQLRVPLQNLAIAMAGSIVAVALLARFLPKTPIYKM